MVIRIWIRSQNFCRNCEHWTTAILRTGGLCLVYSTYTCDNYLRQVATCKLYDIPYIWAALTEVCARRALLLWFDCVIWTTSGNLKLLPNVQIITKHNKLCGRPPRGLRHNNAKCSEEQTRIKWSDRAGANLFSHTIGFLFKTFRKFSVWFRAVVPSVDERLLIIACCKIIYNMISPIVNYILSQNAGEKTSLTLDGRCFVYCTLLIHVVGEKLATLEAIAENKPPPRQLVQKNSYNCPYCAVIKIPFKTFLDPDSNLDRNKIGLLLIRHSVSRQLLEYSAAYSSIL